ncbi:putative mitochondrial J-type chaperone [Emiliania huxleyi CCMP1516]|uniref:J domain-containing protein n=3 Tax=Emiliania huxleyi TaxID=2903 RepID=A0A0D3IQ07_EMIH1|nr:putative mitochondrial J-type chaperone [Emiliania huxleyi CCMP1516]XP_005770190.1 putative mitochondrial J-type chaperone [Emiliania huxleyi CCMP1516]EOD13342.1 putative mitochondrial J-type chaperone [Emiliania huxleyi CCMP1516]EOD17761.1 putative mitochondrial J-type chaperone [Emiliania huxleyi CCMP1516]|eukprot:XP_005765771.1 putative mitochondrial J-type chaperone [Emiliania huxleyi CCMP1516]
MRVSLPRRGFLARLSRRWCSGTAVPRDCYAELDVPRAFAVDAAALRTTYRRLMAEHHPDRHTLGGEQEQQEAANRSARITHAYSTLVRPHRRAEHLLELLGAPLSDEAAGEVVLDDGFLAQVMEARFEIEDPDTSVARLGAMRESNSSAIDEVCDQLGAAFDSRDAGADLSEARLLTARLKYLQRIEEAVSERTDT